MNQTNEDSKKYIEGMSIICPGTMTTQPESINSDLTGQTYTTHTTLNTEQNQLAIKVLPQR